MLVSQWEDLGLVGWLALTVFTLSKTIRPDQMEKDKNAYYYSAADFHMVDVLFGIALNKERSQLIISLFGGNTRSWNLFLRLNNLTRHY
jgi:hypothetical protein